MDVLELFSVDSELPRKRGRERGDRPRVVVVAPAPGVEHVRELGRREQAALACRRVGNCVDERDEPVRREQAAVGPEIAEAIAERQVRLVELVRSVHRYPCAAVELAPVERHVGALPQRVQVVRVLWIQGDSGADRDGLGHVCQVRETEREALLHLRHHADVLADIHQGDELVAAEAISAVRKGFVKGSSKVLEDCVAHMVAVAVVDLLEAVDVHQAERGAGGSLVADQKACPVLLERAPVLQAGQAVGRGGLFGGASTDRGALVEGQGEEGCAQQQDERGRQAPQDHRLRGYEDGDAEDRSRVPQVVREDVPNRAAGCEPDGAAHQEDVDEDEDRARDDDSNGDEPVAALASGSFDEQRHGGQAAGNRVGGPVERHLDRLRSIERHREADPNRTDHDRPFPAEENLARDDEDECE